MIVNYGQIDYYLPFSFPHFLSATISMHSFADHDRTTLKCENHLFYFNLHVNLVVKKLFFFFFPNSKNCKPLIFGKLDRDRSKATLFHDWSRKEGERKREKLFKGKFWEEKQRALQRDCKNWILFYSSTHSHWFTNTSLTP